MGWPIQLEAGHEALYLGPIGQQIGQIEDAWFREKKVQDGFAKKQALAGDKTQRPGHFQEQDRWLRQSPPGDMMDQLFNQRLAQVFSHSARDLPILVYHRYSVSPVPPLSPHRSNS